LRIDENSSKLIEMSEIKDNSVNNAESLRIDENYSKLIEMSGIKDNSVHNAESFCKIFCIVEGFKVSRVRLNNFASRVSLAVGIGEVARICSKAI
jgi:hypothetical protein